MHSFENIGTTFIITLQISTTEQQDICPVVGQSMINLSVMALGTNNSQMKSQTRKENGKI